ncbi:MAG: hypothetical protein JWL92_414 [Candidatus Nomurabacteria bacterium]|nr:hypothetical protein [Candidatus Nomurabacteria bacterium]
MKTFSRIIMLVALVVAALPRAASAQDYSVPVEYKISETESFTLILATHTIEDLGKKSRVSLSWKISSFPAALGLEVVLSVKGLSVNSGHDLIISSGGVNRGFKIFLVKTNDPAPFLIVVKFPIRNAGRDIIVEKEAVIDWQKRYMKLVPSQGNNIAQNN